MWELDAGRYAEQRFVTGYARDPQTWGEFSDHELKFLSERFRDLPSFRQSRLHVNFAEVYLAIGNGPAAGAAGRVGGHTTRPVGLGTGPAAARLGGAAVVMCSGCGPQPDRHLTICPLCATWTACDAWRAATRDDSQPALSSGRPRVGGGVLLAQEAPGRPRPRP